MAYQVIGQPTTSEEFAVYQDVLRELGIPTRPVSGRIGLVSQRGIAEQILESLNTRLPNRSWTVHAVDVDAKELCVRGRCVDLGTGKAVYTLYFDPTDPGVRPWSESDNGQFPLALKGMKQGEKAYVDKAHGNCWIC